MDVLTEPNPELAKLIRQTPDGMAHWSGTGPDGTTCGTCKHHATIYPRGGKTAYAKRCKLYQDRSNGWVGGKIENSTASCKYFEAT